VGLIDVILILGPLAVVPLARPLLAQDWFPPGSVVLVAALLFGVAFLFDTTGAPAFLTVPWFAVVAFALVRCGRDVLRRRAFTVLELALLVPYGYLLVSAWWSFLTRAGWTVAGISEPIVELTGVHFLYAGFATTVLALLVASVERVPRPLAFFTLGCGVVGPVLVASGFTFEQGAFQVSGALVMTAFAWSVAGLTAAYVVPRSSGRARVLLIVSSLSVVAPMVLAVFWAAAQYVDVPALSIPAMARIHGTMNAVGFVGCGLVGWRLAIRQRDQKLQQFDV
jgi:hypothetical protein